MPQGLQEPKENIVVGYTLSNLFPSRLGLEKDRITFTSLNSSFKAIHFRVFLPLESTRTLS
jgi:hypothetical protein